MRTLFVAPLAVSLLLLSGCRTLQAERAPERPAAAAAAADTPPPHDLLNAVVWFQTSAEHAQVYRQVYRAATAQLDAALADPDWDALPRGERSGSVRGLKPAIIVDIDETVLDNAPYSARQVRDNGGFTPAGWDAWVQQPLHGRPGARALPGAVEFAQAAGQRGIPIYFISNRDASSAEATLLALHQAGFVLAPEQFLGRGTPTPGCASDNADDKHCRRAMVARDHRILMLMGDQLSDFLSQTGTPAERRALADSYADWFGQRWWMLPNPMYGSWENATWAGQPGKPTPEEKRAAKRGALDTTP